MTLDVPNRKSELLDFPRLRKNGLETLDWYFPGTPRTPRIAAECVLKAHHIDGSFLLIKEAVGPHYDIYALCAWNFGTPSHFLVKYNKTMNQIEFGVKEYDFTTFKNEFEKPSRIIRSDRDEIILRYPLPNSVREPSVYDTIYEQVPIARNHSVPDILESNSSLGVKGGYLIKRGHVVKNWKLRYFILDKYTLKYYESKPGPGNRSPKLKGVVDLRDTIQFVEQDHSVKQPNSFAIVLGSKTFSISAENKKDYASWVEALRIAINRYQDIRKKNLDMDLV